MEEGGMEEGGPLVIGCFSELVRYMTVMMG